MKEQAQHYELTLLFSGSAAEDQHQEILNAVKALFEKNGARITRQEDLGRRKLAYAIGQLKHGFYFSLEFDIQPLALKAATKELKLNNSILRFMAVKKRVKTEAEISREEKIKASRVKEQIRKKETIVEKPKESTKPKLSLEDLDKKLDELLEKDIV